MSQPVSPTGRHLVATPVSTIRSRRMRWLWEQRVVLRGLTLLAGPAGQGKSLITLWLAAQASLGRLPGDLHGVETPVLVISGEDDPEAVIRPRLVAANAEIEQIHTVDARIQGPNGERIASVVQLPGDAPLIADLAKDTGAKLVIVDPVVGFLDDEHNSLGGQDVRRALGPLKQAAEDLDLAVLLVIHPNKGDRRGLEKVADSGAFVQLVRSVLFMGPYPGTDDRDARKVVGVRKSNYADIGNHAVEVLIEGAVISDCDEIHKTARANLVGPAPDLDLDAVLTQSSERAPRRREAEDFIIAELHAHGPLKWDDLEQRAGERELASKTLRDARDSLKSAGTIEKFKEQVQRGGWFWRLRVAEPAEGAPIADVHPIGDRGGAESVPDVVRAGDVKHAAEMKGATA